eukprot:11044_1
MNTLVSWLAGPINNNDDHREEKKQNDNQFQVGQLCELTELQAINVNGKLCKIIAPFNAKEGRYPVLVFETKDIVMIKPCNLLMADRKTIFVQDVLLYPIKGCKGISLSSSMIEKTGLKHDRSYCLMSTKKKKIISQSGFNGMAKMCWIQPSVPTKDGIQISAPGMQDTIFIPRTYNKESKVCIKYWNYKQGICGYDQGDVASKWLTQYAIMHGYKSYNHEDNPIRLIAFDPDFKRITHKKDTSTHYVNKNSNKESVVSFANDFQFLICSEESLNGLNKRIRTQRRNNNGKYDERLDKIKMDRFRPNIVISSNGYYAPHFEDEIELWETDGIKFYNTKQCPRCGMPSINQQTAKRYKEPKTTLLTYRTGQQLNYLQEKNWSSKLFFGSYFIHNECAQIRRGSRIGI